MSYIEFGSLCLMLAGMLLLIVFRRSLFMRLGLDTNADTAIEQVDKSKSFQRVADSEAGTAAAGHWPTLQEYHDAIKNPATAFCDAELQAGHPQCDAQGEVNLIYGDSSSVYRIQCLGRDVAVKCFLSPLSLREVRYKYICEYLRKQKLDCFVDCEFIEHGIKVKGRWHPILKMEWAEGIPLNDYLSVTLLDVEKIAILEQELLKAMKALSVNGIAHGDLQHGNILVNEGQIKFVDYDGMYVPTMSGIMDGYEVGHPNYQHPDRTVEHFAPYTDHFSAWVIYASLICLRNEPEFWPVFSGGEDCLLLRQEDLVDPFSSVIFYSMENHTSSEVQACAEMLRAFGRLPVARVPALSARVRARTN